jgi:FkbM family methyltransferase
MSPGRLAYYLASIPTLLRGVRNWPGILAALLGPRRRAPFVVRLRDGRLFKVTTALDVWIVKEVCLDRDYEHGGVTVQPGWTVVDIGAGLGAFCISVARAQPGCRVYAFEPFAESFALLQENVRLNGLRNLTLFPCAVGAHSEGAVLHAVRGAPARSSTVGIGGARPDTLSRVPSTTLGEIFRDLAIQRCDFLKLDCEGAEYEILLSADAGTIERIGHVALEYHDGVTRFSGADLVEFFGHRGFAVRTVANRAYPDRLGLLYATNRRPA